MQYVDPRSLILNIEGATDHYRLKSQSESKQECLPCIAVTF